MKIVSLSAYRVDPESDAAPVQDPPSTPPRRSSGTKYVLLVFVIIRSCLNHRRARTPSSKVDLPSPAEKKKRKPTTAANKGSTRASSRRKPPAVVADSDADEFGGYGES